MTVKELSEISEEEMARIWNGVAMLDHADMGSLSVRAAKMSQVDSAPIKAVLVNIFEAAHAAGAVSPSDFFECTAVHAFRLGAMYGRAHPTPGDVL